MARRGEIEDAKTLVLVQRLMLEERQAQLSRFARLFAPREPNPRSPRSIG